MPRSKKTPPALLERAEAEAWLGARVRQLGKLFLLSVALSPVAITVVLLVRVLLKTQRLPPLGPFAVAVGLWTAIIVAIIALVVVLMLKKRLGIRKRLGPVVRQGAERRGTVARISQSSRRKAGVTFHRVTLAVSLEGGETVEAFIEESEGTELPEVAEGALATVWTLGPRHVVGTSGALFESS